MNNQPPYLEKTVITYNPAYGDMRVCKCGHWYYRHFDSYEENSPVGCKYCPCRTFEEATLDARTITLTKADIAYSDTIGIVQSENADILGVLLPFEYLGEVASASQRVLEHLEALDLRHLKELFESVVRIEKQARERRGL